MIGELKQVQHWLQAVITHPAGVVEGIAAPAARNQFDLAPGNVEQVVTRSRRVSAIDRLAIYGAAYHARLLECLREEYPILRHALGPDAFDAFATGYLQEHPSRSYTLNELGKALPAYLAGTAPEEADEAFTGWWDFIVELAGYEAACSLVFDGPGIEGQTLLTADQLLAISPDRWPAARLAPAPCLRLLEYAYPVHAYYAAVRRGEEAAPPAQQETYLAITRGNYVVQAHALERPAYTLLSGLAAGLTVGEAIQEAVQASDDPSTQTACLADWFQDWTSQGFFMAVAAEPRPAHLDD